MRPLDCTREALCDWEGCEGRCSWTTGTARTTRTCSFSRSSCCESPPHHGRYAAKGSKRTEVVITNYNKKWPTKLSHISELHAIHHSRVKWFHIDTAKEAIEAVWLHWEWTTNTAGGGRRGDVPMLNEIPIPKMSYVYSCTYCTASRKPAALTKCPKRSPNLNSHTGACRASRSIWSSSSILGMLPLVEPFGQKA